MIEGVKVELHRDAFDREGRYLEAQRVLGKLAELRRYGERRARADT